MYPADAGGCFHFVFAFIPPICFSVTFRGDMMLADRALLYSGGAGSCMGCGEGTALRLMLAATGFVYGKDKMGIVAATGCNSVFGSTYPFNPFGVP